MENSHNMLTFPKVLLYIVASLFVLLLGMSIVSAFAGGIYSSCIDVLIVGGCLKALMKNLGLQTVIGKKQVNLLVFIVCSLSIFCIFFSAAILFEGNLNNTSADVSNHYEHNWMHENVIAIAECIKGRRPLWPLLESLNLRQYTYLFTYSSLPFVFGGDVATHVCVWNGMNLGLIVILTILIANKVGVVNPSTCIFVSIIALLQPAYNALYVYDRDIVGEVVLLIGIYAFCTVYKKPMKALMMLPVYAAAFYCLRYQYLFVAILSCIWSFYFSNSKGKAIYIGLAILSMGVAIYMLSAGMLDSSFESLNVDYYSTHVNDNRNIGFLRSLVIGFIGYFPWTNLFRDPYWHYHFWLCFQAAMDLVIWYYLYKEYKSKPKELLQNPALFVGLVILSFAFISVGHVKYACVASPILAIGISTTKVGNFMKHYGMIILLFIFASLLYSL